jgi:hypothetical protein
MARPSKILWLTPAPALVLAMLLPGCARVPARPASVPAEATWGGEGRRGVFLKVGTHQGTLWQLEVWDRQGQRLGAGAFRLRGFAKADLAAEEVLGWQDGALKLKDGTWLVPEPAAR